MGDAPKPKLLSVNGIRGEMELVEKRIDTALKVLAENAAKVGDGDGPFGDAQAHRKKIKELVQSVDDLSAHYLFLVEARDRVNLHQTIETDEGLVSIATALQAVRRPLKWRVQARNALDNGWRAANSSSYRVSEGQKVEPKYQMYDESARLKQLDQLAALEIRLKPGKSEANDKKFVELTDDREIVFWSLHANGEPKEPIPGCRWQFRRT